MPLVIERSPELAPVNVPVPTVNSSALSSKPINVLLDDPLSPTIPMSPDGVPDVPFANSISLSDITELVVSKVVVVPDTVILPDTVKLPVTDNPSPISMIDESADVILLPVILIPPAVKFDIPAIVVLLAPKLIDVVPIVMAEFESDELPMFESVLDEPLIVLFVSVAVVSLIAVCI